MTSVAQNSYDIGKPFGWTNCVSLAEGDKYVTDGGGVYALPMPEKIEGKKVVVLKSSGGEMGEEIKNAIKKNDIIIFDGCDGDFIIGNTMFLREIKDKTLVGRNNARLCTSFVLSPEIHSLLNAAKVLELSTDGGSQTFRLPNGSRVKEEREYAIRNILIEHLNDKEEAYRMSGVMNLSHCENIVIRNLAFIGPGAIDVGGSDLITVRDSTEHVWIDHCLLVDGMDGNIDINGHSDFITLSWCRMTYTPRTFIHANTSLVGSSDKEEWNGEDNLNVTYAYCHWDTGCDQRMPMVRFGTVHVLNNLYTCEGNTAAVNPRYHSEVLVEGCFFGKGVKRQFRQTDSKAYMLRDNVYTEKFSEPAASGLVSIPYLYKAMPSSEVPDIVSRYAGNSIQ